MDAPLSTQRAGRSFRGVLGLKWEQRIRPNGDVIAILAVADFRALVDSVRQLEEERVALYEFFENVDPEGVRGEEARLYSKASAVLLKYDADNGGCAGCMGGRCDECPLDDAGYAVVAEKAKAGL